MRKMKKTIISEIFTSFLMFVFSLGSIIGRRIRIISGKTIVMSLIMNIRGFQSTGATNSLLEAMYRSTLRITGE